MCNCIAEMNQKLAEGGYNAAILTNLFGPQKATVDTYKPDEKKRGKPPIVIASYCPFCGEKYAFEKKATAA